MILIHRVSDQNDKKLAATAIGNEPLNYWPKFSLRDDLVFVASLAEPNRGIGIHLKDELQPAKPLDSIESLTISQGHAMIFPMASVLSPQTCILQGPTASQSTPFVSIPCLLQR
jgi:hypothetical protein